MRTLVLFCQVWIWVWIWAPCSSVCSKKGSDCGLSTEGVSLAALLTEMKAPNPQQIIWPEASQACGLECSELCEANLCIGPFVLSKDTAARPVTVTKAEGLACAPWPCPWPLPSIYLHLIQPSRNLVLLRYTIPLSHF